ncbi:MAG: efflux RND transporter permease subunit [Clostridiales bacterium]|jgi:multidrug efflux pump subunit AcrB|nr:efflux RND transporter permease subunit [Clostridiales bacterium]
MLSKISVKNPVLIIVLIIIIIGLGVVSFTNTETDLLPGMDLPYMVVVSIYAGAAPELVESDVTAPVENALASLSGIKSMTSTSNEHYSMVILELYEDADTSSVQSNIERALKLANLPDDPMFMDSIVLKIDPTMLPVMQVSMGRSGESVKESIEYFNGVITRINAVDGVASVSTSGLITNLALISLDSQKMTRAVLDKLLGQLGLELSVPDAAKERARQELKDILDDAESNPGLLTNGALDPAKVLNEFLTRLENNLPTGGDDEEAAANAAFQVVINELKNEGSPARAFAVDAIGNILGNRYIVQDEEIGKAAFYDLIDGIFKEGVLTVVNGTVADMSGMLSSDLLDQLIMAQDLSVPAGSIAEGAQNFVVKIGDAIVSREEFMNTPVITVDLGGMIEEYLADIKTFLRALQLASGGTFTFTDAQLRTGAEAISWYAYVPDNFARWAVDSLTSDVKTNPYYMPEAVRAEWVNVIEANSAYISLTESWNTNGLAFSWRTELLNLIKNDQIYPASGAVAPGLQWDGSYTDYYTQKVRTALDDLREDTPVPADFDTEDAYYRYLADYVINVTANGPLAWSLSPAERTEWAAEIASNEKFREYVTDKTKTDVYDWRRVAINGVLDGKLYSDELSDLQKTQYSNFLTGSNASLGLVPNTPATLAAYLMGVLAETDPDSKYYLPVQFIYNYSEYMINNKEFADFADNLGENDNWQLAALEYYAEKKPGSLPPDGAEIIAAIEWNAALKGLYDQRIDAEIASMPFFFTLEGVENEQIIRILTSYFDGRDPEEVYATFNSILALIGNYGGEGALTVTKDANGNPASYTLDFNVLQETLKKSTENFKLTITMGDLGNIVFLDDSSKQVTTLLTRNPDGTMTRKNSVQISIEKEPGKSTATISSDINALLEAFHQEDGNFNYTVLSDDGRSISFMMDSVTSSLIYGALLAMFILFVFLKSVKATFAVSFSIVISVVFTFTLMYFSGITMNIVSMGGLALGVGMLVDNSIVVLENIYRLRMQGKSVVEAAIAGTKQVSGAIFASTLTTMVVFLPIVFIEGLVQQIFKDLALTICFSLAASLLTALTLIPMSFTTFLKKPPKPSKKQSKIKKAYIKALNFSLNNKWLVIIFVVVLLGGSVFAAFSMGTELFPNNYMGSIGVDFVFNSDEINRRNIGVSPMSDNYYTEDDAVKQAIADMGDIFAQFSDIESAGISKSGGLSVAGMSLGGGALGASVTLVDEKDRSMKPTELIVELERALNAKGGALYSTTVTMTSMSSMFTSETSNSYSVYLYGDDYEEMIAESRNLSERFSQIDGVYAVDDGTSSDSKEYRLSIDKDAANRLVGLTVGQIYYQISAALTEPSSLHTLRIKNETGKKEDVDVYLYEPAYRTEAWYTASAASGESVKIYFLNNDADNEGGHSEYYIKNSGNQQIFVKTYENGKAVIKAVISGGEIPVVRGENGEFYYEYVNAVDNGDNTYDVSYAKRAYSVTDFTQYYSTKREAVDLLTMEIVSEDTFNTGAETVSVPLYKLLSDDCLKKDANGNVLYRAETLNGDKVPMALELRDGYASIRRVSRQKCVTITVSYDATAKSDDVTAAVDAIVAEYNKTKPASVYISDDGGELMVMDEVFSTLVIVLVFAIALIYLVMAAQFQAFKAPLIIMSTIPLAFTGSFLLLAAAGMPISIMAMMGLIILMGVVVNNGIVFVDYANRLVESGVDKRTALFRTGVDRMRPIFMTAATTVLAMIIMAADGSDYGQMLQPLAITSIGGLAYATVVTLFIIPIIYDLAYRKGINSEKKRVLREQLLAEVDPNNIFDTLDPATAAYIGATIAGKQFKLIKSKRRRAEEAAETLTEPAPDGEFLPLQNAEYGEDVAENAAVEPTEENLSPVAENSAPIEEILAAAEETTDPTDETPAATEENPAPTEDVSAATEESPVSNEASPSRPKKAPRQPKETPAAMEESPVPNEASPSRSRKTPSRPKETPAATEESPVPNEASPSRSRKTPSRPQETRAITEKSSAATEDSSEASE